MRLRIKHIAQKIFCHQSIEHGLRRMFGGRILHVCAAQVASRSPTQTSKRICWHVPCVPCRFAGRAEVCGLLVSCWLMGAMPALWDNLRFLQ